MQQAKVSLFSEWKNKDADQTVRMRRLVYTFVFQMQQSQLFSRRGPIIMELHLLHHNTFGPTEEIFVMTLSL